jgi:O-Antigen ligase
MSAPLSMPARLGSAALFAIIPLYGALAALDPQRPPIPPLLPHALAVVVGLAALAAYGAVVVPGLRAEQPPAVRFAFLGGGLATVAAGLTGFDPPTGVGLGVLVVGMGLGGLALSRADAATVRLCVRTFLWSALLAALLALAMVFAHRPVALYAYDNGRAVGTFLNPNELAAYSLVALGCALPLAIATRGRDRLAVAASIALILALAATYSRWGAFSAVCGLAAFALAIRARRWLALAVVVGVAALALDLTAGVRHHNPRDTEARDVAWRTGWTTFTRFPLLGVGPLAYGRTYEVFRSPDAPGPHAAVAFDPHSLPLAFAASGGIVALVTLTASVVILQRRIYRQPRGAAGLGRLVALGLASGLVALYVDCTINTISIFFPLGLQGAGLALAVVREEAWG